MLRRLVALAGIGAAFLVASAAATSAPAPSVRASAVLVGNGVDGELLHGVRQAQPLAIASITKLMTALVVLEHARPGEVVRVGGPAPTIGGSTIGLRAGERLSVGDLLTALLVESANDAAYALAYHVGDGSVARFVAMMNEKAAELGLRDTHFTRPDGLDAPGHRSSARDIFKLARAAMHKPFIRKTVRTRTATIAGGRTVSTWNDLLYQYPGTIGVKTGHTDDAGWSQVAAARRNGVTVYAVILGSASRERRNADLIRLLDWGFSRYRDVAAVKTGRTYAEVGVPYSDARLRLVAPNDVTATVMIGHRLVERIVVPETVALPVAKGQPLGKLEVYEGKRLIATSPLVAAEAVEGAGLGARVGWYAGRALDHVGNVFGGFIGLFS
ncbi:MAG: D-alanyl-D-alanine carboxypeptidase family protein [Gaiellales bacterium]